MDGSLTLARKHTTRNRTIAETIFSKELNDGIAGMSQNWSSTRAGWHYLDVVINIRVALTSRGCEPIKSLRVLTCQYSISDPPRLTKGGRLRPPRVLASVPL
jgi:hypothetical protein